MQYTYQVVCNQISSCALIIDSSLEIKACNNKVTDITGFIEEQLIGNRFIEIFNNNNGGKIKLVQEEEFSLQKTILNSYS